MPRVTVSLFKKATVNFNCDSQLDAGDFCELIKEKVNSAYPDDDLIGTALNRVSEFTIKEYSTKGGVLTATNIALAELLTVGSFRSNRNADEFSTAEHISIVFNFFIRIRHRGTITPSGGSIKGFLTDVLVVSEHGLAGVQQKIGPDLMLVNVYDTIITTDAELYHFAIVDPQAIETDPPRQVQIDLAIQKHKSMTEGAQRLASSSTSKKTSSRQATKNNSALPPVLIAKPLPCAPTLSLPLFLCVPKCTNYSEIALPVVLAAVEIPQQIPPAITTTARYTPRVEGDHTALLNSFISHGCAPLDAAIAMLDRELEQDKQLAAKFTEVLDITHTKLSYANRGLVARNEHNETTHRLVIHEFLAATMEYNGDEYTLEHAEFTAQNTGNLGYGPLDAYIPGLVITECVETLVGEKRKSSFEQDSGESDVGGDADTETERDVSAAHALTAAAAAYELHAAAAGGASSVPVRYPVVEEAKRLLNDGHFAQAAGEGVDIALYTSREQKKETIVKLCLCTAHRYFYFRIVAQPPGSEGGVQPKPVLTYLGDVSVRVLRMGKTVEEWRAARTKKVKGSVAGTPERKPSHMGYNEVIVDREEVTLCLKAMIAVAKFD